MKIIFKNQDTEKEFENQSLITIGSGFDCDYVIESEKDFLIKLQYIENFKSYAIINVLKNSEIKCNGKTFTKAVVPNKFSLDIFGEVLNISIENESINSEIEILNQKKLSKKSIFDCDTEKNRVEIVKEIGYKTQKLKDSIKSLNCLLLFMNIAVVLLSFICAFGMTNFLLGLKINSSQNVLNLTTNIGFWTCMSVITCAICFMLKIGVYSLLEFNRTKRLGDSGFIQNAVVFTSVIFLFMVYVMNLFYYKDIPGFAPAAFFISLLFVGGLVCLGVGGGYYKFRLSIQNYELTNCEYRPDFEGVIKNYRILIERYVNNLSENKLNNVRSKLINNQMKMIIETAVGLLTTPFLAYGVSNTLAMCFPEAANWVRISGLRFSPIFLVLATCLIIFAFFVFVNAFSISKQIKSSDVIKYDGFHDWESHGVNILGLDGIRTLTKEKTVLLSIACTIILIEFTMNVSYFITELSADFWGVFLSFVSALVPTALLIAETNLLSSTMHKINNCTKLLSMLD